MELSFISKLDTTQKFQNLIKIKNLKFSKKNHMFKTFKYLKKFKVEKSPIFETLTSETIICGANVANKTIYWLENAADSFTQTKH